MSETYPDQEQGASFPTLKLCPHLGFKHDPETAAIYARRDHACAVLNHDLLSIDWQQRYCLGPNHQRCPYFNREPVAPENSLRGSVGGRYRFLILFATLLLLLAVAAAVAARDAFWASGEEPDPGDSGGAVVEEATPTSPAASEATPTPTVVPEEGTAPEGGPASDTDPTLLNDESAQNDDEEGVPGIDPGFEFADESFEAVWSRVDLPVAQQESQRSWFWGPGPITEAFQEPYVDAPGGQRLVQYFENSRMELNNPAGEFGGIWYITSGLLVSEMVYGLHHIGSDLYDPSPEPAEVTFIEHALDAFALTYADIALLGLDEVEPVPVGDTIDQAVIDEEIARLDEFAGYGVTSATVVETESINHSVASVFWEFLTSQDVIWEDGEFVEDNMFIEPFYATGFPITEAYWATAEIDGTEMDILWQCFERRCLTYTPDNAPGAQIESISVGRHYYAWRYGESP